MPLVLKLRAAPVVPLEVEGIVPDACQGKSRADVEQMPVFHGNEKGCLADFFAVTGDPTSDCHQWQGDLSGVHWVGAKMQRGQIHIEGNVGRHLGSEMSGGEILVEGDASDWAGGEMRGGLIHVRGKAGHLVGAAYRGSRRGMTGGTLLVQGSVGNELGHTMRRGLIAVGGDCGDLVGFNMLAGTILVFGQCGIRHGAGMKRGTIGLFSDERPAMLPSFRYACRYNPLAFQLIWRELDHCQFPVPASIRGQALELFHGDLIEGGRGEILVPTVAQLAS
ncbi:MAG: formylmethanofuran dehydrogenase subunit C [Planctomycetales bacterium]|nr:formylmethanofuran dehydrogenase subunit C [Planctomycetales bacterium]